MSEENDSPNKSFMILRSRWVIYLILFLLSITLTFVLADEKSLVSLAAKSLFLFIPGMLIFGFTTAIRSHLRDYKKYGRWEELLVIILLVLGVGFFLLLIGLFIRSLVTKG